MSHAEAFGHFRSFVVGLEKNARALRRVLEDADGNAEGKWANGRCGISARCALALESQSPEVTTKELIAEVAEQDKALRGAEALVQAEKHSIDEVSEMYHALAEYNELAFADLEKRLSAYGYVRPTVAGAAPGKRFALPSGADTAVSRKNDVVSTRGGVDQRDGSDAAGGNAPSQDDRGETYSVPGGQQEDGHEAGDGDTLASSGGELVVPAESGHGGAAETGAVDDTAAVVATPVHHPASAVVPEEELDGDEDSPATPTLADWEISEGTREMLRLDQLEKQRQGKSGSGHHSVGAARSLEALLGQHSALAIAGRNHDEQGLHHQQGSGGETASAVAAAAGGVGFARSSVSSSWSPPHLNTPLSARRGSSISSGIGTSIGIAIGGGSDGGGGGGGGGGALAGDGRGIGGETIGMTAASPWRSDPPTPRMPCLGGNGPWTPSEKESGAADADSEVSVDSPVPVLSSPMKTEVGRSLMEAAMSVGNAARETPSRRAGSAGGGGVARVNAEDEEKEDGDSPSLSTPSCPTPGRAPAEDEGPRGGGGRSTGPRDECWRQESPASAVPFPREASGESLPAPGRGRGHESEQAPSPETPCTPPMPSPRYLHDISVRDGGIGGGGGGVSDSVPGSFAGSARSDGEMHRTPTLSAMYGGSRASNSSRRGGGNGGNDVSGGSGSGSSASCRYMSGGEENGNTFDRGGSGGGSDYGDGYDEHEEEDDDDCRTPELSSPPRTAVFAQGLESEPPAVSAALCWRRLEEAEDVVDEELREEAGREEGGGGEEEEVSGEAEAALRGDGPLEFVSQEEYARAPTFLTIQVSRSILNEAIRNLNAYATPRLETPSELLLTVDEITAIIDQGELSRTLLLSAAHLKRVEMKGSRMYRIRGSVE